MVLFFVAVFFVGALPGSLVKADQTGAIFVELSSRALVLDQFKNASRSQRVTILSDLIAKNGALPSAIADGIIALMVKDGQIKDLNTAIVQEDAFEAVHFERFGFLSALLAHPDVQEKDTHDTLVEDLITKVSHKHVDEAFLVMDFAEFMISKDYTIETLRYLFLELTPFSAHPYQAREWFLHPSATKVFETIIYQLASQASKRMAPRVDSFSGAFKPRLHIATRGLQGFLSEVLIAACHTKKIPLWGFPYDKAYALRALGFVHLMLSEVLDAETPYAALAIIESSPATHGLNATLPLLQEVAHRVSIHAAGRNENAALLKRIKKIYD